ncbi:MAG TPA: hypothetical protein VNJ08_05725 [Bacteriovoracaceae bacterium]|nr:hypothetical protein [Bacteriovoracaceae bacterium]
MKAFAVILLMITTPVFACWQMTGLLKYEKTEIKIDQKVEHDKTYSFQAGDSIFHVTVPSKPRLPENLPKNEKWNAVNFEVVQKVKLSLEKVSEGSVIVKDGAPATLTQEDQKTGKLTTVIVKLNHI